MARARLLHVPRDEPGHPCAWRALCIDVQPKFRRPPGPRRADPFDEPVSRRARRDYWRHRAVSLKNWTPRERPGQWPLTGDRVVLEPLDWAAHGEDLYAAVAAPAVSDIWTYMPIGPFDSRKQFEKTFDAVARELGWEVMVIKRAQGGKILGMSSYMRIREAHGSAEIGCVALALS